VREPDDFGAAVSVCEMDVRRYWCITAGCRTRIVMAVSSSAAPAACGAQKC
jgi:hypothetical protein